MEVVVVGGGPAGLMAAGSAAMQGCSVLLLEKMEQCGRKLCITGKGRCNITNTKEWDEFSTHIHPQADFLRPAFRGFSNEAAVTFFQSIGIDTVTERGHRVFPASQSAPEVRDALVKWATEQGVEIVTGAQVFALELIEKEIKCVHYQKSNQKMSVASGAVVLATGGYSFPVTGSNGDGHHIAEQLGHTITPCFPALTGLMPKNWDNRFQGITLNNVRLSLMINDEIVREEFGEIVFTDLGFEGSLGYRLSRQVVMAMRSGHRVRFIINLKAAIPPEQLQTRLQRDFLKFASEPLSLFMRHYLPRELVLPFIEAVGLRQDEQIITLTSIQKERLLHGLIHWEFPIERYAGYDRAIVTGGGVSLQEIRKKDMRSKVIDNLFFAGEIIDLDGDTGGYNLQIAYSTGVLAGRRAADYNMHQ